MGLGGMRCVGVGNGEEVTVEWNKGRAGVEVGIDTFCRHSGPLRNRSQNGVQGADLLEESPVKDKREQWGPSEGEAILVPAKRGGQEGCRRRAGLAPPRHRHGWEQPRERWIFVQTRGLQGTAGELHPAAPLAGLSHPFLGSAREWTEPRRRDQSSISKGGSQSLGVTEQVSSPWGGEGGGLWDLWAESTAT